MSIHFSINLAHMSYNLVLGYIFLMSITQTVRVPASHRLTIDVPREIPEGPVILTFTPQTVNNDDELAFKGECPICAAHRDPVTGEERFNAVTLVAMQEARDIMNGKIQVKWNHSIEEAREVIFRRTGTHSDLF